MVVILLTDLLFIFKEDLRNYQSEYSLCSSRGIITNELEDGKLSTGLLTYRVISPNLRDMD